jgi:hypothetical protein
VVGGELGQVSVVRDDLEGTWGAFQERVPSLEGTDDHEKFFLIDLMIDLYWEMLS